MDAVLSCAALAIVGGLLMSQSAIAASPVVTTFAYDAGDHVVAVTDPRGLVTAYNYDALGQLWGLSSPDTGTTTYGYDGYGRRTSLTRANNVQTSYAYDSLNRLVGVSAGGQTQSFTYDSCTNGIGRLCSDGDATGSTSYGYTPDGWIASRTFTLGSTSYAIGYSHDAMGHVSTVTYPDGNQAHYAYTHGVISGLTLTMGSTTVNGATAITYRPMGAGMAGWTASNGLVTTLGHDTDGRLTGIHVPGVQALGFSYDAANRITGIDNALDGAMSQDFGYDEQSRLVSMYSANAVAGYGYDANGNRINTAGTSGNRATSYSATSNRLVSSTGVDPQSYGYDALGNLTTLGGATAYQYDSFNRMRAAGGMTYYVNPEGQRLRKTGAAGTTYFAPDRGGALLAEYSGGQWINYLWLNGRLIGREVNGQLEAIHGDQLGRPQAVTNASQSVVWSAQNWPFTRTVTLVNTAELNLGFSGQYYDAETGLWHNGFRDYDDTLERYVESDPIGLEGGINTYVYVGNNPLSYVDSLGLAAGDKYSSMDGADIAAVSDYLVVSITTNREYAGVIYKNWDGSYSYTEANIGSDRAASPGDAPWLHDEVAIYHTHGQAGEGKDGEEFSQPGPDGFGDIGLSDFLREPNYLGTPRLAIKKYDPCTRKIYILQIGVPK